MLMQLLLALRLIRLVDKGLLNERLLEYVVWLWINDGLEMVVDDDTGTARHVSGVVEDDFELFNYSNRHHLITCIDVAEYHLLGHRNGIFFMEYEMRVSLHVDALNTVGIRLEPIVEVDHAELGNELVA